jgi:hypothetical protein
MEQKQTNKEMVDELEKVKQEQLFALKPLKFAVNEICNCLIAKHEVAAFTLTNYLFEASLKLTLIYWESGGKLIENTNDFEGLYRKGTKKYLAKDVFKAIGSAKRSKMITEEAHPNVGCASSVIITLSIHTLCCGHHCRCGEYNNYSPHFLREICN